MDTRTVGILGGGQLGRMMVEAAHRLNVKTVILDAENSPAKQINALVSHVNGSFTDGAAIMELAAKADVLTIEIEHVSVDALEAVAKAHPRVEIHPSPATIRLIQDKYLQKEHLIQHGIATAESNAVESTKSALENVGSRYGYPYMLKSRTDAYDGRGNFVVKSADSVDEALKVLHSRPLYAEKWAPFTVELAVMVVKALDGSVHSYPTVETVHQNNICHLVYAPARVPDSIRTKARILAENAVKTLPGGTAGIFGVEMFLLSTGELLINEIAPRPHNSGHYTQDACVTSQFEAHIRAVLGLPLPKGFSSFSTPSTHAIMLNILGGDEPNSELRVCRNALETPGAAVHLYGKSTRPNRKMGHINIVAGSMREAEARLERVLGSSTAITESETKQQPQVGIIMGSDSDLPVMKDATVILRNLGIPYEITIVSAHRTPHRMTEYATTAAARGLYAIIAGAGGAAHLPGMVAAMTTLPVIGVPVKGKVLDGVDSLHSIVQMPRGVPVATVAINNSTNAGLLAARIIGASVSAVQIKLDEYNSNMEKEVLAKAQKLESGEYPGFEH